MKFTSCDNQALVGCIPIAIVAVDLTVCHLGTQYMYIMPVLSKKFVGGFALSGVLVSGRASMLPLETLSLGLWVIGVDPAFNAWDFFQV